MTAAGREPEEDGTLRRALGGIRPYVGAAAAALVVAVLAAVLVVPPADAALLGIAAFAVLLALRVLDRGEEYDWPEPPTVERRGARREMAALSWSLLGREGHVSEAAVRRLRADGRRRLALRGVHLPAGLDELEGNPAVAVAQARALLGDAWDVLTDRSAVPPTLREVEACVVALERLVPATSDGALAVGRPAAATRPSSPPRLAAPRHPTEGPA